MYGKIRKIKKDELNMGLSIAHIIITLALFLIYISYASVKLLSSNVFGYPFYYMSNYDFIVTMHFMGLLTGSILFTIAGVFYLLFGFGSQTPHHAKWGMVFNTAGASIYQFFVYFTIMEISGFTTYGAPYYWTTPIMGYNILFPVFLVLSIVVSVLGAVLYKRRFALDDLITTNVENDYMVSGNANLELLESKLKLDRVKKGVALGVERSKIQGGYIDNNYLIKDQKIHLFYQKASRDIDIYVHSKKLKYGGTAMIGVGVFFILPFFMYAFLLGLIGLFLIPGGIALLVYHDNTLRKERRAYYYAYNHLKRNGRADLGIFGKTDGYLPENVQRRFLQKIVEKCVIRGLFHNVDFDGWVLTDEEVPYQVQKPTYPREPVYKKQRSVPLYTRPIESRSPNVVVQPSSTPSDAPSITDLLDDMVVEESPRPEKKHSGVKVYRGGEIVGSKYVFKIKVENRSTAIITDVNFQVVAYPEDCLLLIGDATRKVSKVNRDGMVSPSFEFEPTKDCVKGKIHGTVSYIDYTDDLQVFRVQPHEISMVCGLLRAKKIDIGEFSRITELLLDYTKAGEDIKIPYNPKLLFEKLKVLLPGQNFELISKPDQKILGSIFIGEFRGFAEGKFNKKGVGIKITISGDVDSSTSMGKIEGFCEDSGMLSPLLKEMGDNLKEEVEKPNDCVCVIDLAREKGQISLEEVMKAGNWDIKRAKRALKSLEKEKIALKKESVSEGVKWYFPGLID